MQYSLLYLQLLEVELYGVKVHNWKVRAGVRFLWVWFHPLGIHGQSGERDVFLVEVNQEVKVLEGGPEEELVSWRESCETRASVSEIWTPKLRPPL